MASEATVVADLLERECEVALIASLLESGAAGSGRGLLVEGPAGIGKTRLLEAARGVAGDGLLVAAARGGEFERDLAYGVVRQLFEPLIDGLPARVRDQVFAGTAALARRALDPGAEARADPGPVREALFQLALRLSRRRPLLILIDDLHWADEASLLWVHHLVRRIERLPLVLVAARRSDEPEQSRVADQLALERLEPAPLSNAAVAQLVHGALGDDTPIDDWHEVTGGNPFLLHELLREAGNHAPDVDVRALAPAGVAHSIRARLERLPADARRFARALSVLERAPKLDDPARLAGIAEPAAALESADLLVAAGVLADREPFEFEHPLVRQAVYADLPPGERATQHERAARLLAERADAEEAAAHLLLSRRSPERWGVEVLRRAAAAASSRGAPELAARQLECALHASGLGSLRPAILGELGLAELRTFEPRGFDHLREAIAMVDSREAARLAVPTARALTILWRHREGVELLEPILARLPAGEASLWRALEGELIATAAADTETLPLAGARLAEALSRSDSSPAGDPVPWGIRAMAMASAGAERLQSVEIARRAIGGGRIGEAFASGLPYPTIVLVWAGEVAAAEAAWEAALDRANRAGSALEAALARCYLAICANARGECRRAEALAGAALEACVEAAVPAGPNPLAPLADALVDRGAASAALAMLERHVDHQTETSVSFPLVLFSRGRARIAAGDRAGVDEVLQAGRRLVAQGATNPAVAPWRSVAALSLGDAQRASELVEEELELARAYGAPVPIGIALTAAASLDGGGLEIAREAVRRLSPTAARRAYADALACEGRTLSASGRHVEARQPLRQALDIAYGLGAAGLAQRVRADLVATGARPRRPALSGPASLTPREERVARLAAQGRSSREIADELVISIRTVDLHLNNAYRKLGVAGRAELRVALAEKAAVRTPKDW
jgi:DNA-binding CsgD family transcriptional regulator